MITVLVLVSIITTTNTTAILAQKDIEYNRFVLVNINKAMQEKLDNVRQIVRSINTIGNSSKSDKTFDFLETSSYTEEDYSKYIDGFTDFKNCFNSTFSVDKDISKILVYKKANDTIYTFARGSNVDTEKPLDICISLTDQFNNLSQSIKVHPAALDSRTNMYSYALTVNLKDTHTLANVATLSFEFNPNNIKDLIKSYYNGGIYSNISVLTPEGAVLFDYSNRYYGQKYPYIQYIGNNPKRMINISNEGTCYMDFFSDNEAKLIIASITPQHEVTKSAARINHMILLICIFALIIAPVFAYLVTVFFSRRIKVVTNSISKIKNGYISERIPLGNMHDEISDISSSINHMCDELESFIQREYISEINQKNIALKLKNAELKNLQAQINPHFLYNTLEAIRMKANLSGARETGDMIMILSKLFRSTIKASPIITIDEEIQSAKLYLKLFELKYRNLSIEFDIDEEISGYGIIRHIIQPLLENCIVHGYNNRGVNLIKVKGLLQSKFINIEIHDNGNGIDPDRLQLIKSLLSNNTSEESDNIGLTNVHDRIRMIYGEECGLSITSEQYLGTTVIARIYAKTVKELDEYVQSSFG
jgi:Putative regulator of cell autolysis